MRHPEHFCDECGRENVVWFAPNDLWNRVVRERNLKEILCPVCFIKHAEEIGICEIWKVAPDHGNAT